LKNHWGRTIRRLKSRGTTNRWEMAKRAHPADTTSGYENLQRSPPEAFMGLPNRCRHDPSPPQLTTRAETRLHDGDNGGQGQFLEKKNISRKQSRNFLCRTPHWRKVRLASPRNLNLLIKRPKMAQNVKEPSTGQYRAPPSGLPLPTGSVEHPRLVPASF